MEIEKGIGWDDDLNQATSVRQHGVFFLSLGRASQVHNSYAALRHQRFLTAILKVRSG